MRAVTIQQTSLSGRNLLTLAKPPHQVLPLKQLSSYRYIGSIIGGPHLVRPHLVWSSLYCGYYKFYKNLNSAESSVMVIVIVRFHNPKIHLVQNPQVVLFTTYDPHLVRIHLVRKIF